MTELKPCPFCGGEARLVDTYEVAIGIVYGVMCFSGCCAVTAYRKDKQNVIDRWNRRVID